MISSLLSLLHIKRTCGERSFQKGLAYWKQGNVIDVQENDSGDTRVEVIKASVKGSGNNIYQQHIELRRDTRGGIEIDGECSCPVGYDCKHVAAALLYLVHHRRKVSSPEQEENRIDAWLDDLKSASKSDHQLPQEEYGEGVQYRLVYVLEPDPESAHGHGLQVATYKVRLLKKGGYGKPASFSLSRATEEYYANDFVQPSDQDIAKLLANNAQFYYSTYSSTYTLKRELGELALQKMLLTGRCHWQDIDTPTLQLGSAREISFHWEATEYGQQLIYELDPPCEQLVRVGIFWYIDAENGMAGPVDHPVISANQLEVLLDAPVIPSEHLQAVSRKLLLETPEYDLETPVELEIEKIQIEHVEPACNLSLRSIDYPDDSGRPQRLHCARLGFRYGPVLLEEIGEHRISQIVDGDKLYRIVREPEAEARAVSLLSEIGLHPMRPDTENPHFDWVFIGDNPSQTALLWHEFLEHDLPELEAQGWEIDRTDSFQLTFEETDSWDAELETTGTQWFTLTLGVDVDGTRVNLLPVLVDILARAGSPQELRDMLDSQPHFLLPMDNHRWLKIPSTRLRPIFETLVELYDREPLDKEGNLKLSRYQSVQISDLLNDPQLRWRGALELQELNRKLQDFSGITPISPPANFNAELRNYQEHGLAWLQFLREFNFSGILADDMGLGKTVQTLAHLLIEKQSGRMEHPCLVVAPTSLMGNWRREAAHFAPDLDVVVIHGPDRQRNFPLMGKADIVLTTYPLLRRDKNILLEHEFHIIVLDEAQSIKNPKSQTTQVVFELKGKHQLCLTGTPLENHLGELWSMFHFLMPGFLGPLERFNRIYRNPIEKAGDGIRREQLRKRIAPFMLRRTKTDVATELPEKTEIIRSVTLEGQQRDLYESIRLAMDKKVREEITRKGLARSQIMILDALLKLRQVCCDPRLLSLPQAKSVKKSAKLELLMQLVPEMIEEGRKILLFSQFTSMLALIEEELKTADIDYCKLTGQTRKRDEVISQFQEGNVPIFLISLKAGGVGLNLTAADTVIHYDPWWNPAVENQATDRAHRIGQDKAVFVYKLITEDSVEDKILALQEKKQALANSIYSDQPGESSSAITADDLNELLKPLEN